MPATYQKPQGILVSGVIKTSLEKTALHVELSWAKDRRLLLSSKSFKGYTEQEILQRTGAQMCEVRMV